MRVVVSRLSTWAVFAAANLRPVINDLWQGNGTTRFECRKVIGDVKCIDWDSLSGSVWLYLHWATHFLMRNVLNWFHKYNNNNFFDNFFGFLESMSLHPALVPLMFIDWIKAQSESKAPTIYLQNADKTNCEPGKTHTQTHTDTMLHTPHIYDQRDGRKKHSPLK